jgi:hypothetical protein
MKLTLTNIVTYVGVSILLIYAVIGLMKFYGVNTEDYSIYIIFYIFIFISVLILGNSPS